MTDIIHVNYVIPQDMEPSKKAKELKDITENLTEDNIDEDG
jgi:hypothetical protein